MARDLQRKLDMNPDIETGVPSTPARHAGGRVTYDSLFIAYRARACLSVLVGDMTLVLALRLAHEVWDRLPAEFPGFAEALLEGDVRAACWDLAEVLRELPGTWEMFDQARGLARDLQGSWT